MSKNIFSNVTTAKNDQIEEDYLGSGGVFDSDVYQGTIKTAYLNKSSSSNAQSMNLIIDIGGRELRYTSWMSNRDGEVTYKDKKSGEKRNLPGYNQINSLCLLTCGKEIPNMDVEELTVKLYDYDAKKELPQAVDCFTELHEEEVLIAVQKQVVDKTAKNDATNKYEPTGETREQNDIVKFFAIDVGATISEISKFIKNLGGDFEEEIENENILKSINILNKIDSQNENIQSAAEDMFSSKGRYLDLWLEKNKGETYDKSKGESKSEGTSFKKSSTKKTSLFD